jgi:hypothetical protein
MKKIIKLTENDLLKLVKKVVKEQQTASQQDPSKMLNSLMACKGTAPTIGKMLETPKGQFMAILLFTKKDMFSNAISEIKKLSPEFAEMGDGMMEEIESFKSCINKNMFSGIQP